MSSAKVQQVVAKKRQALARKVRREKAKAIASRNFLGRKITRRMKTIIDKFPDIGQTIENYVKECNVGADAWRRTGVLTFDGNRRVKQKATYRRIQQHLQDTYDHKFSYGTTIQLCVARNRRHRSSKNYRGVAHVTSRRARKGFEIRYNPDTHWSSALYKGLNLIQYTDGANVCNLNRDDASGFRLDTLATHSQYRQPVVYGHAILTMHTDYVNKYPSVLQTSSYNFTGTKTTGELCAGVVKAHKICPKNPAQHFADLKMLTNTSELKLAFINPHTGEKKLIECMRVDGATDEGPAHEEVQFWFTARHLEEGKMVSLLSSRSSGSSYLNRVELQNGCLSLGHGNLFIPSTLGGSVIDQATGTVDKDKLRMNMELAMDVYISRVNHSPCGDTQIHLFKGADSTELQEQRQHLQVFLKGSQKKEELRREKPTLYSYFDKVWTVKNCHQVPDLPSQYLFLLICCYGANCPHPLCQIGRAPCEMTWFPGGPTVKTIPMPIPDPSRPWGNPNCTSCSDICSGHYLKPEVCLQKQTCANRKPPSAILKEFFLSLKKRKATPTELDIKAIAEGVLLPSSEVEMWLEHLQQVDINRKRGAAKAAETRRRRAASTTTSTSDPNLATVNPEPIPTSEANVNPDPIPTSHTNVNPETIPASEAETESIYYCGYCGGKYEDETEDCEFWIGCEACDNWFHGVCVGIAAGNEPEVYICGSCKCE